MEIKKDFIPEGRNNRPGHTLEPEYITIHDTGNTSRGAGAEMHAQYLKSDNAANAPVSWHFTVDENKIYQHLPLDENGWHAGDGSNGPGNRKSIGIEICENRDGDRPQAEENAAWLTAKLLKEHGLDIAQVKQHYDWSGKNCPRVLRGRNGGWEEFLKQVEHYLKGDDSVEYAILINTFADFPAVEPISERLNAPIYLRKGFNPEHKINKLYIAGGGEGDLDLKNVDKVVDLSGEHRWDTAGNLKVVWEDLK